MDFNRGWWFRKEGESPHEINLPHDAMLAEKRDPFCPNGKNSGFFPGGKYIYEKNFNMQKQEIGKHVTLFFEGVYQNCTVSINGQEVGKHKYGFTEFALEISDFVIAGNNTVTVFVDNSLEPNCRWYTGSGIYRPVSLFIKDKDHISDAWIETLSYEPPVIFVNANTTSETPVWIEIFDGQNRIASGTPGEFHIQDAKLWEVDHPYLYTCIVKSAFDEQQVTFGIRKIEYHADTGLLINGKETLLRGGCIHHDNGVLGACGFADAEWRRVQLLKKAGYNAIRCAHNPGSRALLDACDRLGMLVMDEAFDGWYIPKSYHDYSRSFWQGYKDDLKAMVKKDWNHPSVIMYSIGNEVSETATQKGVELCGEMADYIRSLDKTRPVTCGINVLINVYAKMGIGIYKDKGQYLPEPLPPRKTTKLRERKTGSEFFNAMVQKLGHLMFLMSKGKKGDRASRDAAKKLDIMGLNYGASRYDEDVAKYPERIMVGAETMVAELPYNWSRVKKHKAVIGDFTWASFDYLGEGGAGSWTYNSYPGLLLLAGSGTIDITGKIGAECYFQRVVWGLEEKPYICVRPVNHNHETPIKSAWRFTNAIESWNWQGFEGERAVVEVYSNADSIRLELNQKELGTKKVKNYKTLFKTVYKPGKLTAIALDSQGNRISEAIIETGSEDTILNAFPEKRTLRANGQDLCFIRIEFTDAAGYLKPTIEQRVEITVDGPVKLQGFGSALVKTNEVFNTSFHSTYQGSALAVVRSGYVPGKAKVAVNSADYDPITFTLEVI